MPEALAFAVLDAAGNRFALLDLWSLGRGEPEGFAELARGACAALGVDGLLVALADGGADSRMVVLNADGSRPEACGNGLRCVAAVIRGGIGDVSIATDAGVRRAHVLARHGRSARVAASVGAPRIESEREALAVLGAEVEAGIVSVGNPHCVVAVDDVERTALAELGPALAGHPRFPGGVNVEFVAVGEAGLRMRVFERGVGETGSCGTGAAAAAAWAVRRGLARSPVAVEAPGGTLVVSWDGEGEAWIEGPVGRLGTAFAPVGHLSR